jgi:hypothetical protein
MAETKTSRPKRTGSTKARKRPSSSAKKPRSTSGGSRAKAKRPGSQRRSANASSNGVSKRAKAVRDSVEDAGQKAGHAGSQAASKAKLPLIAGGAAMVGAASGLALAASRSKGSKVLGMRMPKTKVKISSKDVVKGADKVARAGEKIGRLSTGFREIQGTRDSSNGNDRSPIEVVLQGLTRRR